MVRANGVTLNVQQLAPAGGAAAAPTVVLLHGLVTDSLASWYFTLAKPLADAGLHVVMYDLRGHGRSERPPSGYHLENFVDDLAALLPELGLTRPVHLLGNSFGGTVALSYAVRCPDRVATVGMIESGLPTNTWAARMAASLGDAATRLPHPETIDSIRQRHGAHRARLGRLAARLLQATTLADEVPASRGPTARQLAGMRCPVLSVYAGESDLAGQARLIGSLLPCVRTVVIPDAKHTVLVDRPDIIYGLLKLWLIDQGVVSPVDWPAVPPADRPTARPGPVRRAGVAGTEPR